jgi:hypothetical protein
LEIRRTMGVVGFGIGFVGMAAAGGVPTDLIPNPWFTRMTPPQSYAYPVWLAAATLTGVLVASCLGVGGRTCAPRAGGGRRAGVAGAVAGWLAVGCPVCNKLVVAAVGVGGALSWFAPIQPWLAAVSVLSLLGALWSRARILRRCVGGSGSERDLEPGAAPAG